MERYPELFPTPKPGDWQSVATGVYWVQLSLPFSPGHINLYLLEDSDGWWLVDTGLHHPDCLRPLLTLIDSLLGEKPLKAVIVTHHHPDHLGNAGLIQACYGVPVHIVQAEYEAAVSLLAGSYMECFSEFYRSTGLGAGDIDLLLQTMYQVRQLYSPLPHLTREIDTGDVLVIGDREWKALVTSGHSPGHLCLFSEKDGLLISGDQVLPAIHSNVSVLPGDPHGNPLEEWLVGLEGLKALPADVLVLPSHNHPFRQLHDRLDQLIERHHITLDRVIELLDIPLDVVSLSEQLYPNALKGFDQSLAVGQTLAHLNYLKSMTVLDETLIKGVRYFSFIPNHTVCD